MADNGIGMDAETLAKVFDLFAQADRSLDRSRGGLGIGLTLVRSLAEQHGGSVEATSHGPDLGSEFIVRLPAIGQAVAPPEASGAVARGHAPLRVLLVDDNVDGADTLALLFRTWGCEVHTAYDGVTGLEAVRRIRPDVAFLDIGLPRMNGYDVARAASAELGDGLAGARGRDRLRPDGGPAGVPRTRDSATTWSSPSSPTSCSACSRKPGSATAGQSGPADYNGYPSDGTRCET